MIGFIDCGEFSMIKFLRFLFTAFALSALIAGSAHAFLGDGEFSEAEKVGFAFYKLGQVKTDFGPWVTESESFVHVKPIDKKDFLQSNVMRLEQGFHNYHPDEDLIAIKSRVYVETDSFASKNPIYAEHGIIKRATIYLDGMPENYIPFRVGNTWVAMVPENYNRFTKVYLTAEEFKKLHGAVGLRSNVANIRFEGEIELVIRPLSVDTRKPIKVEKKEMWLMGVEVGSMIVWSKNKKKIIWEYSAPWFVTDASKNILDLYKD